MRTEQTIYGPIIIEEEFCDGYLEAVAWWLISVHYGRVYTTCSKRKSENLRLPTWIEMA